jgi:hypothetical protein
MFIQFVNLQVVYTICAGKEMKLKYPTYSQNKRTSSTIILPYQNTKGFDASRKYQTILPFP